MDSSTTELDVGQLEDTTTEDAEHHEHCETNHFPMGVIIPIILLLIFIVLVIALLIVFCVQNRKLKDEIKKVRFLKKIYGSHLISRKWSKIWDPKISPSNPIF